MERGAVTQALGVAPLQRGADGAARHPCHSGAGLLRSRWDALFLALALVHGELLVKWPSLWLIGIGMWWNANTISHNFIHSPFFRAKPWNALFSAYLSLLLGVPQSLWRARHLAHHREVSAVKGKIDKQLVMEGALLLALWAILLWRAPMFFLTGYLPGLGLGLCLCHVQGYFEHVRGTVSHYGRLYNLLFFNDGYHVEHHRRPGEHWTQLPKRKQSGASFSRWPAVLRWLELLGLGSLEICVLRSRTLQSFVLKKHERAFRIILARMPELRAVGIIGGGLFPRTALILKRLAPEARLTVVEASGENILRAKEFLKDDVEFIHQFYGASTTDSFGADLDLLVVPLAFEGNRAAIYERPPARQVLVHDWLWRRRGCGVVISWILLKRLNLVQR